MQKTTVIVSIAIALGAAVWFLVPRNDPPEMAPIVDEACQAGYTRLGEGCVPLKEACEAGGDGYVFDEARGMCVQEQ